MTTPAPSATSPTAVIPSSPAASEPNLITISVRQLWSIVVIAASSAVAILAFGFFQGKEAGAVKAGKELADMRGIINNIETDLKIQTDRALQASERVKQYEIYTKDLKSQAVILDQQIKQISAQFQQTSSCRFAQSQLAILEQRIHSLNESKRFPNIFGSNSSDREKNRVQNIDEELEKLQTRSIALTQQLGACQR